MSKIRISIRDSILEIAAGPAETRRFVVHYERVVNGEPQGQRRFVFRAGGDRKVRTLIVDMKLINWVELEEDEVVAEVASDQANAAKTSPKATADSSKGGKASTAAKA